MCHKYFLEKSIDMSHVTVYEYGLQEYFTKYCIFTKCNYIAILNCYWNYIKSMKILTSLTVYVITQNNSFVWILYQTPL
jgi:hypothetical protein